MADSGVFDLPIADKVGATVAGTDAAIPSGVVPNWALTDPDATVSIVVAADGLSAEFTAQKVTGANQAKLTVAIPGASGTASIVVTAPAGPTSLTITFGVPAPK